MLGEHLKGIALPRGFEIKPSGERVPVEYSPRMALQSTLKRGRVKRRANELAREYRGYERGALKMCGGVKDWDSQRRCFKHGARITFK